MKIPQSVRIGSMDYKVIMTDEILLVDHVECFGKIDYNKKEIYINTELQNTQGQEQTLLHEIVHGITHERRFSFDKCDDETNTDELACGIHQLIRDNKEMFI